jgi:hypothetical protein
VSFQSAAAALPPLPPLPLLLRQSKITGIFNEPKCLAWLPASPQLTDVTCRCHLPWTGSLLLPAPTAFALL